MQCIIENPNYSINFKKYFVNFQPICITFYNCHQHSCTIHRQCTLNNLTDYQIDQCDDDLKWSQELRDILRILDFRNSTDEMPLTLGLVQNDFVYLHQLPGRGLIWRTYC